MLILAIILSVFMGITMAMLGGGGTILTVPILVYVLALETKTAIATSLLVVMATGSFSLILHARAGNVQWATGFAFGPVAMVGAFCGGLLAKYIPSTILMILFTGLMIVTAVAMLRPGKKEALPPAQRHRPFVRYTLVLVEGLGVGLATGLVGAGGGFLIVPVLVLLGGLSMHNAVGTALLVIVMNATASFVGYLSHAHIDYRLAGIVVAAALCGAAVGSGFARRVPQAVLRKVFAWFVLVMAGLILYRERSWEQVQPILAAPWAYWAIGVALLAILVTTIRFARSPAWARRTLPLVPTQNGNGNARDEQEQR